MQSGQLRGSFGASRTPHVTLDIQLSQALDGALVIVMDFDPVEHEPRAIDQLLSTYRHLLLQLASYPEGDIAGQRLQPHSPLAPKAPPRDFKRSHNLHRMVLDAAHRAPSKAALIDQSVQLSFAELVQLVNACTVELSRSGCQASRPAAVVCEKGWEQVVSVLSITSLGAHYLPIIPTAPDNHILSILTAADVKVATCQERTLADRGWFCSDYHRCRVVMLSMETLPSAASEPAQPADVDEDATAYIIFTSGSTGKPKGVAISHRGAANTCFDINERFGVGAQDAVFAISNLAFDLSVYDIFGALAAGATLVMCSDEKTRDPDHWWQQIDTHRVSLWNSVPTLFEMLLETKPAHFRMPLTTVMLSGDAIRMDFADRVVSMYPEMSVHALGGATEASIWSNHHEVTSLSKEFGTTLVPYGSGLSNQALYVLDGRLENRPLGATGEIFIGGRGIAIGYHGQPELTAQRFIVHPILGRIYATGIRHPPLSSLPSSLC